MASVSCHRRGAGHQGPATLQGIYGSPYGAGLGWEPPTPPPPAPGLSWRSSHCSKTARRCECERSLLPMSPRRAASNHISDPACMHACLPVCLPTVLSAVRSSPHRQRRISAEGGDRTICTGCGCCAAHCRWPGRSRPAMLGPPASSRTPANVGTW